MAIRVVFEDAGPCQRRTEMNQLRRVGINKESPMACKPSFPALLLRNKIMTDKDPADSSPKRPDGPRRLELKEGREHLTVTNEFQSDKYPWCPAGFVPIKITDPLAMDLLSEYADRRRVIDAEFTRDLNEALTFADTRADSKQPQSFHKGPDYDV